MSQLVRILLRTIAVSFGFAAACLTTAVTYAFLSGLIRPDDFETYNGIELGFSLTIMLSALSAKFAQIAFVPAFIVIIIFEIRAIRDWLAYLITAAVISVAAQLMFEPLVGDFAKTGLYAVSAMAGGFIYWLFVGQRAGKWRG